MHRLALGLVLLVVSGGIAIAEVTDGAVPGEQLKPLAPAKLAGVARSNLLDQAFAVGAAYKLDDGGYLNLDIQNTFHRGTHDTSLEDHYEANPKLCGAKEKVTGYTACVHVRDDGSTTIHWYLPDRLVVIAAAPTEKLARAMAKDLPLAAIAKLSAAK